MNLRKAKRWLVGLCSGAIPLVTEATCFPEGGFNFFRDDDGDSYGCGDCYYEDVYYYDDCGYYDDCYYDETIIVYDE